MGHTMSIHSQNEDVILQFGLKKPAFRICVNTPTTHGSIGLTTGLDPAMTLGCGGPGGNITSDNITPRHLLNLKRLAYELRPAVASSPRAEAGRSVAESTAPAKASSPLPKVAAVAAPKTISAQALATKIDSFLASRGYKAPDGEPVTTVQDGGDATRADNPAEFICEDDVRAALRSGRKLLVGERTIITPAARDLGESQKVFQQAGWPR
jgi:acetaldehyde dehydrogenase (acetylating)